MSSRLTVCSGMLLCLVALGTVAASPRTREPQLMTGDVVFQTSRSSQSKWIQLATESPYSHLGLIEVTAKGAFVIEAIQPVSRTPWEKWRARGASGFVRIARPRGVSVEQREAALAEAKAQLGKPYDPKFGWGDEALYCSELVHKAYAKVGLPLGRVQRLGELDLRRVEKALRQRFGTVPEALELVTPASIASDPALLPLWSSYPVP